MVTQLLLAGANSSEPHHSSPTSSTAPLVKAVQKTEGGQPVQAAGQLQMGGMP